MDQQVRDRIAGSTLLPMDIPPLGLPHTLKFTMPAEPTAPFFLIVTDHDRSVFSVEGPMTDDRPWIVAARFACNHYERHITCGPTGTDRDLLAAGFRQTHGWPACRRAAAEPTGSLDFEQARCGETPLHCSGGTRTAEPCVTSAAGRRSVRVAYHWDPQAVARGSRVSELALASRQAEACLEPVTDPAAVSAGELAVRSACDQNDVASRGFRHSV